MHYLVTGGNGFLGGHIVRMLLKRGDRVTSLARRPQPHLEALGVRCIQGDIGDKTSVLKACEGVDGLFHVAALAEVWGKRDDFYCVNVLGTRNMLEACKASGVSCFVYTSSPSVVFHDGNICGADEALPYPSRYLSPYPETKALAEQEVLQANGGDGGSKLFSCALRPHLIYGAGDTHLIPRLLEKAECGKLRIIGDGRNRVSMCAVENAAYAHLLAMDALKEEGSPVCGSVYFINDEEPVFLYDWINTLLKELDMPPVSRKIPYKAAYGIASLLEGVYRFFSLTGEPPLTRFVVANLATSHYFDITKARRELGYTPLVSSSDAFQALVADIKREGLHLKD